MDSPRRREDTSPPILPAEDLSGVFEAPGLGDNLVGTIVAGRYTVTQLIGSGGMGCVYQAFDAAEQQDIALKVLKNDRIDSSQNVQRFMQEARVMSMLTHPNVVRLIDFGQDENGVLYLAMERLQGTDLADYLTEQRRLQWPEVSDIALQLVRGLAVAHERGIVHRDLKPENVYLSPGRPGGPHQVKLLDFGIAKVLTTHHSKLTTEGSVFGTARYMSPEQASGEPVDARSDVYGVGILLYEMLTGRPPFTGDDFMRTAHQHVSEPPRPLSHAAPEQVFLPTVEELVMRALAKAKSDRYGSMSDFEAAIQATLFDADSTMAMVLPQRPPTPPAPSGGEEGFEQTVIKSLADIEPPSPHHPIPELSPPPRRSAPRPPSLPPPIVASRSARVVAPSPARRPAPPPARRPAPPPDPEEGFEQTVIKSIPTGSFGTVPPPVLEDVDRTMIRSSPAHAVPSAVPVDPTVAIHRPDPAAVGGTMVVRSPFEPPSLPDLDDDLRTSVHVSPHGMMPPPALPPPSIDAFDPPGAMPPPAMPSPGGTSPGVVARGGTSPGERVVMPSGMSAGGMPPGAVPPPSIQSHGSGHAPGGQRPPPAIRAAPFASAPGRAFVSETPPGQFGPSVAGPAGPMFQNQERPVFASEQNAGLMANHLAPQRLASPAAHGDKELSPEEAFRTPFGAAPWAQTEETGTVNENSGHYDGEFLLRPPDREISRNLLVAVVIISMLGLAALSFVLWTMFREEPGASVDEPHPATMAGQPRPAFSPDKIEPEQPKFPEIEDDDFEQPEPRGRTTPAPKVVASLSKQQIDDGFDRARAAIDACAKDHGAIKGTSYQVSFDVVDKRARNAKVQPPHNLTPLGRCVATAVNTHASFAQSKQPSLAVTRKIPF